MTAGVVLLVPVLGEGGALVRREVLPGGANDPLVLSPAPVLVVGERFEDPAGLVVGQTVGVVDVVLAFGEVGLPGDGRGAVRVGDDRAAGPVDAVRHPGSQALGHVLGLGRGDLDLGPAETEPVAGLVSEHPDVPLASQGDA